MPKTPFHVLCRGVPICAFKSYYSMELEPKELLFNASRAADNAGYDCMNKLKAQQGVPCEELTVEEV